MDIGHISSLDNSCSPIEGLSVKLYSGCWYLELGCEELAFQEGDNPVTITGMSPEARSRVEKAISAWQRATEDKRDAMRKERAEQRSALILSAIPPDIDAPSK